MFFQFSIRHLEFRKYLESENVGDGTVESGIVENRGGSRWNFVSMWLGTGDMGGG